MTEKEDSIDMAVGSSKPDAPKRSLTFDPEKATSDDVRGGLTSASWAPGARALPEEEDAPPAPLPDLTEHLKRMGMYDQYVRWREGYMKFRRGEARGATGEISRMEPGSVEGNEQVETEEGASALASSVAAPTFSNAEWEQRVRNGTFMQAPEFRYPRDDVFRFHRTSSYWIATVFLEGSIIFTMTSALEYFGHDHSIHKHKYVLMTVPNFLGSCFFLVGCYLSYFQLINMKNKDDPSRISFASLSIPSMSQYAAWESIGAVLTYFFGCILFQINVTANLFPVKEIPALHFLTVKMTNCVGCTCFVLAATFETLHNRSASICSSAMLTVMSFFLGCVGFFISAFADLLKFEDPSWPFEVFYVTPLFVGSALFTLGSVAQFALWKDEQFGLTLMRDLNAVPETMRMAKHENGFSWRGIGFQLLYTTTASFSILSICISAGEIGDIASGLLRRAQSELSEPHSFMSLPSSKLELGQAIGVWTV